MDMEVEVHEKITLHNNDGLLCSNIGDYLNISEGDDSVLNGTL